METIIPLLIAAVVFGLQAYANFQKEQEKARKRNPGQRPPSADADPDMRPPSPLPPYEDGKPIGQPNARRQVPQPQHEEWHPFDQPQSVSPAFEKYTGTVHAGGSRRTKQTRRQTPNRLQVTEEEEFSESGVSGYDFDLRDAVIKAAILERPYK